MKMEQTVFRHVGI